MNNPMNHLPEILRVAVALRFFLAFGEAQTTPPQPAIRGVIVAGAKPQLIKDGYHGLEGPVATPEGRLYFSDLTESRIYKLDRDGSVEVWREHTNGTNGLYLLRDGRLLCAEGNGQRIISISSDGTVTALATEYKGKKLRQPNDLIADRKGGIYFSDPAPRPAPDVAPEVPGNVHYIRPNGAVLLIDDQITRPNGLTLSLDQRTLYVDDTEGEYVYAFDVQPDGSATNKRQFVKLKDPVPGSRGMRSRADGMAVDSEGRLYVATGSGVQVVDRQGHHLGTIRVPAIIRNIAFSGPDRRTMYMTGLTALYRVELVASGPSSRAK
jgi:gluconolactonase